MLFSFIIVVPLVPIKIKISVFPVSFDLFLGGTILLIAFFYVINEAKNNKHIFDFKIDKNMKSLSILIILFWIISILSVTYAKNRVSVVMETIRFLEYVFLFYSIIIIADENSIKRSLNIFYAVMIVVAICGIVQFTFNLS